MHVVGIGLALMFLGAIAVLAALSVERRRRRVLEQESWVKNKREDDDDEPVTCRAPVGSFRRHEEASSSGGRRSAPPGDATSPWSPTAVDDAQLDPAGQGLALAPGRHTIVIVCSDCAKARALHKELAARTSLASIVAPEDEPPITSAVFQPIDPEPLRQAHGGASTTPPRTTVPRHAADPWDFAHHDRRRR